MRLQPDFIERTAARFFEHETALGKEALGAETEVDELDPRRLWPDMLRAVTIPDDRAAQACGVKQIGSPHALTVERIEDTF